MENACYSCVYYQRERYNEKDLCEYEHQVNGGMTVHIPKDKGLLCTNYKRLLEEK